MTTRVRAVGDSPESRAGRQTDVGRREWLAVGLAVAAVGWGANQFVALLLMYRADLGISEATVQATYALYAVGLIPGLLLGGPFSDRYGRRRVMVQALIASVLASLLLIAGGTGVGWLFVGRLAAGIASGIAFSAGTAWIKELSFAANDRDAGARRSTVAMTVGFAASPLVAGLLAQWAPMRTVTSYLPHVVLTMAAIPLVLRARETHSPNLDVTLWEPLRLPAASARRFRGVVVPLAPWVYGTSTIALAYLPGLVHNRLGNNELLFSAVVTALSMVAGVLVQPLASRVNHPEKPRLIAMALGIVITGLLLGAVAAAFFQPLLIAAAALVLGAGYGCCLVCGLAEVQRMAGSKNLARLTAVFQAIAYLGFAAPYVLVLLGHVLTTTVLLIITAGVAGLTLAWTTFQAARRPRADHDAEATTPHS